jgi:CHASE2 domain-containing sensor protein
LSNQIAEPFDWAFARQDLADLIARLDTRQPRALAA